jgi:hypothetical protein
MAAPARHARRVYYTLAQRWALAMAAAVHASAGGDARWPGGMPPGAPFEAHATRILDEQWQIRDAQGLTARVDELHARGAWPEVAAVAGWGARAGLVTEARALAWMLRSAKAAQAACGSWVDFAQRCCGGGFAAAASLLLARADSPWRTLDWAQPLDAPVARRSHVRAVACRSCGARKVRPAPAMDPSAHVHCDFCGELTDVDWRILVEQAGSPRPTAIWRELLARHGAALAAAKVSRDEAGLRATFRAMHEAMTLECPAKYSPRIHDAAYRAQVIEVEAEMAVVSELDDEAQRLTASCADATRALQASLVPGVLRVPAAPFWAMVATLGPLQRHVTRTLDARGLLARHPDRLTPELHARIGTSVMVQSFLPFLDDADAAKLLADTGLAAEYVPVPDVALEARACGGCGATLEVAPGAARVVCDFCGRRVEVGAPAIACPTCDARVSVAIGVSACPYCATLLT